MIKSGGSYLLSMVLLMVLLGHSASAQPINAPAPTTQVVMLGTGTPGPDPDRSGPATAIVVNATPYLIDFGPGIVRRAKAAVIEKGVKALEPINLRVAFATHLHSDHTVGYPDLILTPWGHRAQSATRSVWSEGYQGDDAAYPCSVRRGYQSANPTRWQSTWIST